jgi:hypothetical protein
MQEKPSQTINFDKTSEITLIIFLLYVYVIPFWCLLDLRARLYRPEPRPPY